jgi:hypothetical protein
MMSRVVIATIAALSASCSETTPPSPNGPGAPSTSRAPDPRGIYDLREKCGRDAREWFQHFHADDVGYPPTTVAVQNEYSNHYNERLNRCYAIWLNAKIVNAPGNKGSATTKAMDLFEVNDNQDLGRLFMTSKSDVPVDCYVGDQRCGSQKDWEALAAPYMSQ